MILANARNQLSRQDAQLAVRLVARDSLEELERAQQRLADEGLDAILDDERLPSALLASRFGAYASLPLFLYVMVRHALIGAGERDRQISDYVAAILMGFGARGRSERISQVDDELYDTLSALLGDVNDSDPRRAFLVRAHLGNRAMWIAGLFPDYVEQRKWRKGGPDLSYFDELGRRGFELAAEHRLAHQYGMAETYAAIAARFGVLRVALNSISDRLFFPNVNTPERLMRQVQDEGRWKLAG
ncbi:MAG TPA: hypothetical protein VJ867_17585 [Gemmatimonadaceae bacterium]|nr:hypothetical protein [Gemmatimonadaceae bacterium]